jgi:hypothetical protein
MRRGSERYERTELGKAIQEVGRDELVEVVHHVVVVARVVHVREHQAVATADIRLQNAGQRNTRYQPIALGVFGIGVASSLALGARDGIAWGIAVGERRRRLQVGVRQEIVVFRCGIAVNTDGGAV